MNSTTLPPAAAAKAAFPAAELEAMLRAELIEAVKLDASLKGTPLSSSPAQITRASVQIDSLVVVEILCAIEPIVGFDLPDSVVRAGGYRSVESALADLLPPIEKLWTKRKGAKG